jgi:phosphatidylglycerophosphate synthase
MIDQPYLSQKQLLMLNRVPLLLMYLRLTLGVIILLLAFFISHNSIPWIITLIIAGLLSDVFDGIIARKLGISSAKLRKLDSIIDRIFWLFVAASSAVLYQDFMYSKVATITLVLLLEVLVFVLCLIRFGRIPSPHNLLSKLWGIMVAAALIDIIINGSSVVLFNGMIALGIISRLDSLLIHIVLKEWHHDIPSFYHAWLIRMGKSFKKNDLLNG